MGYKIHSFNISNKKSKKIKLISNTGKLLKTYDVPNFDNCYIKTQDTMGNISNYIINGVLYSYFDNHKIVDNTGICTSCCNISKVSGAKLFYIKNNQLWLNNYGKTTKSKKEDGYIKVTGGGNSDTNKSLGLMSNGNIASFDGVWKDYTNAHFIDIFGTVGYNSRYQNGYMLDINNNLYKCHRETLGLKVTKLASNVKYGICYSYNPNTGSSSGSEYSTIKLDDVWYLNNVSTGLKVKEITIRPRIGYAIGIDGNLYYTTFDDNSPVILQSGKWNSLAITNENKVFSILNNKVYLINSDGVMEIQDHLGNGCKKLEGSNNLFLVYCEE